MKYISLLSQLKRRSEKPELKKPEINAQQLNQLSRRCVHCGFCNATCPSYQILGNELDGPRGRIYQIKQLLDGQQATDETLLHLDRCLTCRNCETTCPSGVDYSALLEEGRRRAEEQVKRPLFDRLMRRGLLWLLPNRKRFAFTYMVLRQFVIAVPKPYRDKITPAFSARSTPASRHKRKVIVPQGCVQNTLDARINADTAFVLNKMGVQVECVPGETCCGAVEQHLSAEQAAVNRMKQNIDVWWPLLESGAEAIISNASACGLMVQEYPNALANHPVYAEKAKVVAEKCIDIALFMAQQHVPTLSIPSIKVAVQEPCTFQHGQRNQGELSKLMKKLGFECIDSAEPHLCCGAAGTYSVLQSDISQQLKQRKLDCIAVAQPDLIVSANIGCLNHLQETDGIEVKHWVSLLAECMDVE